LSFNTLVHLNPKFSIVIPTRNRSEWLAKALEAALGQTFPDLEVVVVNNDTIGSTASESLVSEIGDSRVCHIRTGGLGMAENWQVGVEAARGEFLLVCSDKLRLLPWLLQTVNERFRDQSVDAVVWQIGDHSLYSAEPPSPLHTRLVEGVDIMRSAASGSWHLFLRAGARGMTSVIRKPLVARVKSELGVPICRQACPDFTMALSLAALGARNSYIDHVGAVFLPRANGNGYLCLTAQDEKTVSKSFEVPNLDFLPTTYMAAVNGIYHDILSTIGLLKPEQRIPINWEMYFVNLIHEAVNADDMGGFGPMRRKQLICAIHARPLKFRLSLLKTILVQETTNLIRRRRKFTYQLSRMMRLLYFPTAGLIMGGKKS
jgi:glycosyltransferase involved in cell wall biosynthesis